MRSPFAAAAVLALAAPLSLAACHAPAPAHDALVTPAPAALPAGVESCAVLGEIKDGKR
jgi:hypothetical protein